MITEFYGNEDFWKNSPINNPYLEGKWLAKKKS